MEEEELKAVLREAFGDSSSDSDGESSHHRQGRVLASDSTDEVVKPHSIFGDTDIWEPITEIKGLWICRDFLSTDQQASLISALEKDLHPMKRLHNGLRVGVPSIQDTVSIYRNIPIEMVVPFNKRMCEMLQMNTEYNLLAMRFGDLPAWALELSYYIRENILLSGYFSESLDLMSSDNSKETRLFPPQLLWREPLFNQLIVNIYQPGEGICAHVDLVRFEDGIAIISLESSCVMHFSPAEAQMSHLEKVEKEAKIPVHLTPGSVVLMWGEARYLWKHEINRKPGFQTWEGQEINQRRTLSQRNRNKQLQLSLDQIIDAATPRSKMALDVFVCP
ncbi:UNVERIFIED_CONTAM: putative protein P8A3.02c [Sesamum radiatum]|uniref:Fe2OG dioxygenase domain-containing protein n=1 Tax=Sesamum radiatum TaxID=300843 RepID=A0AAW2W4V9_SESRA